MNSRRHHLTGTRLRLLALAFAGGALAGCDWFDPLLEVESPGQVVAETLDDPRYANLLVQSAVTDFECALGGYIVAAGTFLIVWTSMAAWWMATVYPFAAREDELNPYWRAAWEYSRAPGESFLHWAFWDNVGALMMMGALLLVLTVICGTVGGAIGASSRRPTLCA